MIEVLLTDPTWWYANRKTGGERNNKTKFGGGARKHYPLMKDAELLTLAPMVQSATAENCAIFMWATMPRLDFAIELLQTWGFRYATTAFVWIKTQKDSNQPVYGPGTYTASNAEVVLLGIKGSMQPARKMMPSVIIAPRTEHSAKPPIHGLIEKMYPGRVMVEMFARRTVPGWVCTGNQLTGQDVARALPAISQSVEQAESVQQLLRII